jgi:hypothetical protein
MKIFKVSHNQNASPTLAISESTQEAITFAKEYLLHTQLADEDDIIIGSVVQVEISEDVIKTLANQYAESESSCFTNDMYGYINGFKKAMSILNPTLFNRLYPK